MVRRRLSTGVVATSCALCSSVSATALPARLELELTTCDGAWIDAHDAEQRVRAELETDGVEQVVAAGKGSDARLTVRLGCDSALTTRMELRALRTGRARQRSIALADADRTARGRALVLAVAEFVRSDWPQLVSPSAASAATTSATGTTTSATGTTPNATGTSATGTSATGTTPNATGTTTSATGTTTKDADPATLREGSSASQADAEKIATPAPNSPESTLAPAPITALRHETPSRVGFETEPLAQRATRPGVSSTFAANARVRWFVDYASVSFGAELGPDIGPFRIRVELLMSSREDVLGRASLGTAALGLGYRVLAAESGPFAIAGYPLAAAGATWLRGTPAVATVQTDPTTGFYGDLRFVLEARLRAAKLSPTLATEVGRAWGLVARADQRVLGASGGFFIGASAGGRY